MRPEWPQSLSNCVKRAVPIEPALQNMNVSGTRTTDLKTETLLTLQKWLDLFHQTFQVVNGEK